MFDKHQWFSASFFARAVDATQTKLHARLEKKQNKKKKPKIEIITWLEFIFISQK